MLHVAVEQKNPMGFILGKMNKFSEPPESETCEECGSLIVQAVYDFYKESGKWASDKVQADLIYACECTSAWAMEESEGEDIWPEHWPDPQ